MILIGPILFLIDIIVKSKPKIIDGLIMELLLLKIQFQHKIGFCIDLNELF